ncbi:hypothetical protein HNQ35_002374 [Cerasibacillus quisquiliarum]|nr:hypothetical protein [Cerasibacillus quisquiliarum]
MRKVVGTPGPFAMAVSQEIFVEQVYYKMGEKEGK